MPERKTSRFLTRLWRVALVALAGLAGLLTLGAGLQAVSSALDRARIIPPGDHVQLGDNRLYVHCTGPEDAAPVILVNGMGTASAAWAHVQSNLSRDHRVCSYDRAGTGFSDSGEGPQDADESADRPAELLDTLGIEGPILLAGHSYGGLIGRVFGDRYPERIAGLVLVDSAHEDMGERLPPEGQEIVAQIFSAFDILRVANRFGVVRLFGPPAPWGDGLEGAPRDQVRAIYASVSHMRGASAEAEAWLDGTSTALARDITSLGALPISILVADQYQPDLVSHWIALQREFMTLSTNTQFEIVAGADHFGLIQRVEFADRVAEDIRRLGQTEGQDSAEPLGPLHSRPTCGLRSIQIHDALQPQLSSKPLSR